MSIRVGSRLGPYEILAKIGEGGMGEVYRGRDTRLNRDVAIKVLPAAFAGDPDAVARLEREALSVASLSHPNILAIYELDHAPASAGQPETTFLVTELVDGETLRARMAAGPVTPRRAIAYAQQIARGLAAAHARGLVHRDLKPENVMITRDDQIKILDFGLAKPIAASATEETRAVTAAGVVVGTFAYMAPEQVRGLDLDPRSDIFALGATLYEMLTGTRAFTGETAADTMSAVLSKDPPDLDVERFAIPPALDRICRRCLEKAPELRFQSATDLAFAFETLSTSSARSQAAWLGTPVAPRRTRLRLVAAAAMLAVLALLVGFLAGRLRAGGTPHPLPAFTRLTFRRGLVTQARFAPDGQGIVYSAIWDSEPQRIYPVRLDRPRAEAQPIADGRLMAVSGAGDVAVTVGPEWRSLFIQRGTLAQIPLAGGEPRLILEDVTATAYAPDGRLAVVRAQGGRTRLEFPAGTVLYETSGWLASPRFSSDGARLALIEHPLHDDDRGSVALIDVGSKGKRAITPDVGTIAGLAWAPGDKEVCYATGSRIECVPLTSGAPRFVVRSPVRLILHDIASDGRVLASGAALHVKLIGGAPDGREIDLSWQDAPLPVAFNHDGSRLLFGSAGYDIFLRTLADRAPVRLGDGMATALSADDRNVLAIVPAQPTRLAIVPTGAGETKTLPRGAIESHNWAVWTPDGRRVVMTANEPGRAQRLYVQNVDGGDPSPISAEGVHLQVLVNDAVAPDGRSVLAEGPDGVAALYPLAGGAPQPIAGLGNDLVVLGWSDTPNVIYARQRGFARLMQIFRVNVVSGTREPWRTIGSSDLAGAPIVFWIVVSPSGHYAYGATQTLQDLYLIRNVFGADPR